MALRSVGIEAKNELENTVSTVELSEMIAESLSEGLLDPEEHNRLSRALQIRNRVVADVAVPLSEIRAVSAAADGTGPTLGAIQARWPKPAIPGSRSRQRRPVHRLRPHQGRAAAGGRSRRGRRPVDGAAAAARCPASLPLPDALSRLRRSNSHLALVTADDGGVTAMVALEDLVEDLVGTVRDGPTVAESLLAEAEWTGREQAHRGGSDDSSRPHLPGPRR